MGVAHIECWVFSGERHYTSADTLAVCVRIFRLWRARCFAAVGSTASWESVSKFEPRTLDFSLVKVGLIQSV